MQTIMMTVSHSLRGGSGCESLAKEKSRGAKRPAGYRGHRAARRPLSRSPIPGDHSAVRRYNAQLRGLPAEKSTGQTARAPAGKKNEDRRQHVQHG
ncbi:hypothetical protein [Paraburkholderia caballeronis]|uniref:hypothetical protein n=1 Tax=Paraburkholderia caballeronis TaxID=416943 RepID=UPI001416F60F|nr:hypothetical protein [Paraburkholderia caballeronis]